MLRLGRRIGSTFDSAALRADNGAGRILRSRLYGVESRAELSSFGPRQGTDVPTPPYRLDRATDRVAVKGQILRIDKTSNNTYTVSLDTSPDGMNWTPLVEGATHSGLGPHEGGPKDGQERSVRLQVELGSPLPAGTYLRVRTTTPNTLRMAIILEVE